MAQLSAWGSPQDGSQLLHLLAGRSGDLTPHLTGRQTRGDHIKQSWTTREFIHLFPRVR